MKNEKLYPIQVCENQYKLAIIQIALLSRDVLNHFLISDEPYVAFLLSESDSFNQVSTNYFISLFNSLISLFSTETELLMTR
jgi:hypothetical protein